MTEPRVDADHPYAPVRVVGGGVAYVSGIVPDGPDGTVVSERDAAIRRVLEILAERVEAAGFRVEDVAKATVFLTDLDWRDALNLVWREFFGVHPPARTAVEVVRLPRDAAIEIEAVVHVTP